MVKLSKKCLYCGKTYIKSKNCSVRYFLEKSRYCSRRCRDKSNKNFLGHRHTEETKRKIRQKLKEKRFIPWNKGKQLSEEIRKKISNSWTSEMREKMRKLAKQRKFYLLSIEKKKGKPNPEFSERLKEWWRKGKLKPYWTGKQRLSMRGEKNPCWNNGSSLSYYRKNSAELKEKIPKVIERDKVCKICGKKGEVIHHIDYNRKNNQIENLILLCRSCHSKTNFRRSYWEALLGKLVRF